MKTTRITLAVTPEDLDHLHAVLARNPMATRHGIAVAALRGGLDQMCRDQLYAQDRLLAEARHQHARRSGLDFSEPSQVE
jgi:hypothetical protein